MHPKMTYYADDRASERDLAAAERQMGCSCSPLGRMISRVITRCNGRQRQVGKERFDYAMAYPPAQTYYVRPNAHTVTYATNNHHPANAYVHTIQPESQRSYGTMPGTAAPPHSGAGKPRKKKKKKKRVRFTPEAGPMPSGAPPLHAAQAPHHVGAEAGGGAVTATSVYHHGASEPYCPSPAPPAHGHGQAYGYGYGRYAPSPLPRWEMVGTPRQHEYFSSEYRWYYPTPVRESIYSFATDANHRLTNIFSEENPNACTIV